MACALCLPFFCSSFSSFLFISELLSLIWSRSWPVPYACLASVLPSLLSFSSSSFMFPFSSLLFLSFSSIFFSLFLQFFCIFLFSLIFCKYLSILTSSDVRFLTPVICLVRFFVTAESFGGMIRMSD